MRGRRGRERRGQLAQDGADVAFNYERSTEAVRTVKDMGGSAHAVGLDLAEPGIAEQLMATAEDRLGGLDSLVNNVSAVEAIRHAQGAEDWGLAVSLLADHWPGLWLGGQAATVHELLAGFPAEARAADAELAAVAAANELRRGRWRRLSGT